MSNLLISDLEAFLEKEKENTVLNRVIAVFLNAMNDWPYALLDVEDYLKRVRFFAGDELTKNRIEELLNPTTLHHAWQVESLTQLVDVFQFYGDGVTLDDIILDLKRRLAKEVDDEL